MQHDLMEWLSVQKVYTPSQLRKVKAELNAKVARMSPQELVEFMQDMEVKLKILMSPEAEEARLWVERTIAVRANITPEQLKRMRPDVLNMTSAQLEQRLTEWQDQRKRTIAAQQAFDKGKATEIKNIEAMEKDEEHEGDEALNRAYYDRATAVPTAPITVVAPSIIRAAGDILAGDILAAVTAVGGTMGATVGNWSREAR